MSHKTICPRDGHARPSYQANTRDTWRRRGEPRLAAPEVAAPALVAAGAPERAECVADNSSEPETVTEENPDWVDDGDPVEVVGWAAM